MEIDFSVHAGYWFFFLTQYLWIPQYAVAMEAQTEPTMGELVIWNAASCGCGLQVTMWKHEAECRWQSLPFAAVDRLYRGMTAWSCLWLVTTSMLGEWEGQTVAVAVVGAGADALKEEEEEEERRMRWAWAQLEAAGSEAASVWGERKDLHGMEEG